MADKPSYIGLFNAIANGERVGHKIFRNWAEVTTCDDIRGTLQTVAIREAEHAWAFEKRLCELGFGLREERVSGRLEEDAEGREVRHDRPRKIRTPRLWQEVAKHAQTDGLLRLLADTTIDPQTGALLGRFICEERDTVRRLKVCYETLKNGATAKPRDGRDESRSGLRAARDR